MTKRKETLIDRMTMWYRGNEYAVQLSVDLWNVMQVWDDLIDDKDEVTDDNIHDAFGRLIYQIPTNPFYAEHAHELAPLLHSTMLQWRVANVFENDQKEGDLHKAWMLRDGVYQLFVYIASLAVDPVWATVVGPDIWRTYGETLEDFVEEMKDA